MPHATWLKFALTSALLSVALVPGAAAPHGNPSEPGKAAVIRLVDLPKEGHETYELIRRGGPFPYEKDGTVFGNREQLLALHKRGYWREYTVKTPGSRNRGARRIVCGGPPRTPNECHYTADHYASFRKIVE